MRLIFAGTPEPAVVALEKLLASDHEVIAVLTRPDAPKGRGRTLQPSPVSALAQQHGIEILTPTSIKPGTPDGEAFRTRLEELSPDCIPVVAYGNLITQDLLDAVPHGWVNLHFSLLPAWRGAAPVQSAIRNGDTITGATTFRIDQGLDTGDILDTLEEPINPTDTADDLLTRLAYVGADLLVKTMDDLAAGKAEPRSQVGEPSYAHKILTDDAQVQWDAPGADIDRLIRSVTPGPGAWTTLDGQRFKLGPVTYVPAEECSMVAGELMIEKNRVLVGTNHGCVKLDMIQPQGKKRMQASDWARGLHNKEGLRFE
ncbi:methionyl-tRNA formyltransferase [Corynebacterium silvaticum]|uniref:Methionyl-tRNA formyltransferase n=1 Tax=Corynebacterium silvaticum TaxID=2320431 RepID=A0A7Y4LGI1_9CORY|nr:methionyl-tRNA formyltransferase [Corynebacterium silvaticum]ARU46221.1 methionyl-tRNA formyltransferase [Corynebacterium silvaticum]MBH5299339.1 methionyl-tRNA formyltransferase [Corynebacterium silvaticum]NOM64341.1 methionyl-tRNA formyltransferase [Corynebacterium silvaticum]NON69550.1 methionyl-tRNA formyltransferase [Corynebacterium silvaticum]TFA94173.1 methionyl-tRNA formyltransferase [Corynebacterium silvaticum]